MNIPNETVHPFTQALQDAGVRLVIDSRPTTLATKGSWKCYEWAVRILCDGRETAPIPYKMGKDKKPKAPKLECVAHSLILDASCAHESFADWCGELGYEEDSRKALETYLACQESERNLRKVLGKHYNAICDAAQDY